MKNCSTSSFQYPKNDSSSHHLTPPLRIIEHSKSDQKSSPKVYHSNPSTISDIQHIRNINYCHEELRMSHHINESEWSKAIKIKSD